MFLIPELCVMTGFTDKMKNDFNLNKDISATTLCSPSDRMKCTIKLITDMIDPKNEKSSKLFEKWQTEYYFIFNYNILIILKIST